VLRQKITHSFAALLLSFGAAASAQKSISVVDLIIDRSEYTGQTVTLRCDYFYPTGETSLVCRDTKTRLTIYARVRGFIKNSYAGYLKTALALQVKALRPVQMFY
jgi:hypothetical protein